MPDLLHIYRHDPELVDAVVAVLREVGEVGLVELFGRSDPENRWLEKTVVNVVGDLAQLGAVQRLGRVGFRGKGPDTRSVRLTPLGRAWVEGRVIGLDYVAIAERLALIEACETVVAELGIPLDARMLAKIVRDVRREVLRSHESMSASEIQASEKTHTWAIDLNVGAEEMTRAVVAVWDRVDAG